MSTKAGEVQDAAVSEALDMLGFGRASANIVNTMNLRIKSLLKANRLKWHEEKLVAVLTHVETS